MVWFLFLLAISGIVGALIWDYRRRAALREAASRERFEKIFQVKPAAAPAPELTATVLPTPGNVRGATAVADTFAARERFLGQAQRLIYLLLRTGIPDHEIFANVALSAVVGAPGGGAGREQELRRLSPYSLDFVVCDRDMRIVAVVEIETPGGAEAAGARRFKSDCLRAAGIRLVVFDPSAPPQRNAIRSLVCGGPDSAGGS